MNIDRQFLIAALSYAVIGLVLGIYMAASHEHVHRVTHAHILLIGFVLSFVYGIVHKLWVVQPSIRLSMLQFVIHQLGAAILLIGLFLLYGGFISEAVLGPVMGIASVCVLAAMLLMIAIVMKGQSAAVTA